MNERSRFIKVRVNEGEYRELRQRADAQGVTMSEHVRASVTAVHKASDVASELSELRHQFRQLATPSPALIDAEGAGHREMLLLLRELAAARDTQILTRVRAQLAARSGGVEQRGGAA